MLEHEILKVYIGSVATVTNMLQAAVVFVPL